MHAERAVCDAASERGGTHNSDRGPARVAKVSEPRAIDVHCVRTLPAVGQPPPPTQHLKAMYRYPSISRTTKSRTLHNPDDFPATDPAYSTEIALFDPDSGRAGRILGNQGVRRIKGHLWTNRHPPRALLALKVMSRLKSKMSVSSRVFKALDDRFLVRVKFWRTAEFL